jgi:hypothetical protein
VQLPKKVIILLSVNGDGHAAHFSWLGCRVRQHSTATIGNSSSLLRPLQVSQCFVIGAKWVSGAIFSRK